MISQVESDVKYSFWFTIFCHTTSIWESKQNLVHFLAKCGPWCQKNKVKQVSFDIVVFLYDIGKVFLFNENYDPYSLLL